MDDWKPQEKTVSSKEYAQYITIEKLAHGYKVTVDYEYDTSVPVRRIKAGVSTPELLVKAIKVIVKANLDEFKPEVVGTQPAAPNVASQQAGQVRTATPGAQVPLHGQVR